jgi:hypothetical protein
MFVWRDIRTPKIRAGRPFKGGLERKILGFSRLQNDGRLACRGAPPWCYTVNFWQFEKSLFLKDFFAH